MVFATLAIAQEILPIDLTALLAVFMGVSIVLIPVIGLTARFALNRRSKPSVASSKKRAATRLFRFSSAGWHSSSSRWNRWT